MSRVDFIRLPINEIIRQSHCIPHIREVDGSIIRNLQIPIHPQKPRQGTVHAIMKCNSINSTHPRFPHKEFPSTRVCQSQRGDNIPRPIIRLSSSSHVECTEGISAGNFSWDVEVLFSKLA